VTPAVRGRTRNSLTLNSGRDRSPFNLHPMVQVEKSGLLFLDKLSLHSWETVGRQLVSIVDSSTWWIADWLSYGESSFQDRYLEALKKTNLSYQTLRNYAWVARRFEIARRRDVLSFGHHAEVAALEQPEQDYWLRKAEELGWSRNQLRSEVKASQRERRIASAQPGADSAESSPSASNILELELTKEQDFLFKAVSEALRQPFQAWAIDVLDSAARQILSDNDMEVLCVQEADNSNPLAETINPGLIAGLEREWEVFGHLLTWSWRAGMGDAA
jgi:hypothetical protein